MRGHDERLYAARVGASGISGGKNQVILLVRMIGARSGAGEIYDWPWECERHHLAVGPLGAAHWMAPDGGSYTAAKARPPAGAASKPISTRMEP